MLGSDSTVQSIILGHDTVTARSCPDRVVFIHPLDNRPNPLKFCATFLFEFTRATYRLQLFCCTKRVESKMSLDLSSVPITQATPPPPTRRHSGPDNPGETALAERRPLQDAQGSSLWANRTVAQGEATSLEGLLLRGQFLRKRGRNGFDPETRQALARQQRPRGYAVGIRQ